MIETGNRNFWIAQTCGWGLFILSNLLYQFWVGLGYKFLLLNSIVPFCLGLFITTIFRYIIKRFSWKKWHFLKLVFIILCSTLFQTILFMAMLYLIVNHFFGIKIFGWAAVLSNALVFINVFLTWNLIYFCIHFANNWQNSELEKWKLVAEMKDAQLGSLRSQVNPHFVFNALNNIRSLILEDKEKARKMLVNFSDLFRYSLKHSETSTVIIRQEIEVVNQYLELLSIQFEDKLKYSLNVDEALLDEQIPPMILQILIENAVKHGISQFKEGGHINLDLFKSNGFIQIELKNTGSLETKSSLGEKLGIGLENIKERLQLIYEGKADFNLKEANNFVIATVKIPAL